MRFYEFVTESTKKLRKNQKNSIPGASIFPQLDNNNNPYLAYRFGIALASSPDNNEDMDTETELASNLTTITYSDAEQKIVNAAAKKMGVNKKAVSSNSSTELDTNNTVSPVAAKKKNKYGV
jgi:hypothetical protein